MFVMSGFSGQISSGAELQPCSSDHINSGQVSPRWWEQMVQWGKASVVPGLLLGFGVEVIRFKVPPHLDPPGAGRLIDLGPVTPAIPTSGAITSGYSGSNAC